MLSSLMSSWPVHLQMQGVLKLEHFADNEVYAIVALNFSIRLRCCPYVYHMYMIYNCPECTYICKCISLDMWDNFLVKINKCMNKIIVMGEIISNKVYRIPSRNFILYGIVKYRRRSPLILNLNRFLQWSFIISKR